MPPKLQLCGGARAASRKQSKELHRAGNRSSTTAPNLKLCGGARAATRKQSKELHRAGIYAALRWRKRRIAQELYRKHMAEGRSHVKLDCWMFASCGGEYISDPLPARCVTVDAAAPGVTTTPQLAPTTSCKSRLLCHFGGWPALSTDRALPHTESTTMVQLTTPFAVRGNQKP